MIGATANGAQVPDRGDEASAVVLFAHGSRSIDANEWHRSLASRLAERTGRRVEPAFLELAAPDLPTAVDTLVAEGHRRIVVMPCLLAPGRHAREDLPKLVDAAVGRHPGVAIALAPILGEDPALVELLASRLDDAGGK